MTKFTFATSEEGFDAHIDQSVRGYSNLWTDVLKFSEYFVEDGTCVCRHRLFYRKTFESNEGTE